MMKKMLLHSVVLKFKRVYVMRSGVCVPHTFNKELCKLTSKQHPLNSILLQSSVVAPSFHSSGKYYKPDAFFFFRKILFSFFERKSSRFRDSRFEVLYYNRKFDFQLDHDFFILSSFLIIFFIIIFRHQFESLANINMDSIISVFI